MSYLKFLCYTLGKKNKNVSHFYFQLYYSWFNNSRNHLTYIKYGNDYLIVLLEWLIMLLHQNKGYVNIWHYYFNTGNSL